MGSWPWAEIGSYGPFFIAFRRKTIKKAATVFLAAAGSGFGFRKCGAVVSLFVRGFALLLGEGCTVRDGAGAEFRTDPVHGAFQLLRLVFPFRGGGGEQIQLLGPLGGGNEVQGGDGQHADRMRHLPGMVQQFHAGCGDVPGQMGAVRQLLLPRDGAEGRIADRHLYTSAVQAVLTEADSHCVRQDGDVSEDVLPAGQIAAERGTVADGFDWGALPVRAHRRVFQTVGIFVKLLSHFAEQVLEHCGAALRQLADGVDPILVQRFGNGFSYKQQRRYRQREYSFLPAVRGQDRGGVRLFVIAAQLGKDLVEGHAHGTGQPCFVPHHCADLVGNDFAVAAEQMHAPRDIQPAFVDAERFHKVSIATIDGVDLLGVCAVTLPMRRQKDETGTFPAGLPDGFRCDDAVSFGGLVFSQDNTVAGGGVAAYSHGFPAQLGILQQFHGGVKAIHIAVQNGSRHSRAPPYPIKTDFSIAQK